MVNEKKVDHDSGKGDTPRKEYRGGRKRNLLRIVGERRKGPSMPKNRKKNCTDPPTKRWVDRKKKKERNVLSPPEMRGKKSSSPSREGVGIHFIVEHKKCTGGEKKGECTSLRKRKKKKRCPLVERRPAAPRE